MPKTLQITFPNYGQNFMLISYRGLEKLLKLQTSVLGAIRKKLPIFKRLKNIVEVENFEKELSGNKVEMLKFCMQQKFL